MNPLSVERARYYYLKVLCIRSGGMVHRNYLDEKVDTLWRHTEAKMVRQMLDGIGQEFFDSMARREGFAVPQEAANQAAVNLRATLETSL